MSVTAQDLAVETAVLGAALLHADTVDELAEVLEPAHFARHAHGVIYRTIRQLHQHGQPVDLVTVTAELARLGLLDDVGGPARLAALTDGIPRRANVQAYATVIRNRALLRQLRALGTDLAAATAADDVDATGLLEQTEQQLFALTQTTVRTEWLSSAALSSELFAVLEQLAAGGAVSGLATGFRDLDRMTRGLQPADLVLLGARPSMGKTAWGLQVAMHAAASTPVAFFSVEMARQPLGLRGLSSLAEVDSFRLLSGFHMSDLEQQRLSNALGHLGDLALHFDESPTLSPLHVRSKLRRLRSTVGRIGFVVIDYLQLMAPLPEHARENKTNQVAGISRALKILAREFGVPFLVLSQLNRATEGRGDKRPTMADLRDSGALEQDADLVLLLHRPGYYDTAAPQDVAEIVVAKQRNGPTGIVEVTWHASQMRFETKRP